jgi:hypothetical protein
MTIPPDHPPTIDAGDLEQLISAERFGPYRRATASADEAVRLYEWNARASGAYAELLQHVEVLVRNAMHDSLTAHYATILGRVPGATWFDSPSWVRHHWFNRPAQDTINKAVAKAGHSPTQPRPGKVVAEIGFGFWRYLASDRYEQSLWVPALDGAFAAPGQRVRDRRRAVEDRLGPLHLLRNRIAHCEPIFGSITYKRRRTAPLSRDLAALHADALELVGWISPDAEAWLTTGLRYLPALLAQRP